jgi:hypothetical protein
LRSSERSNHQAQHRNNSFQSMPHFQRKVVATVLRTTATSVR